jgi:putative DNA methylase
MTHMKKLIEVALPLDEINEAANKENNIHTGLPANLHTWWSRKPLGMARSIIFSSLVDDPGEYLSGEEAIVTIPPAKPEA